MRVAVATCYSTFLSYWDYAFRVGLKAKQVALIFFGMLAFFLFQAPEKGYIGHDFYEG
jgi:hypothetical protein